MFAHTCTKFLQLIFIKNGFLFYFIFYQFYWYIFILVDSFFHATCVTTACPPIARSQSQVRRPCTTLCSSLAVAGGCSEAKPGRRLLLWGLSFFLAWAPVLLYIPGLHGGGGGHPLGRVGGERCIGGWLGRLLFSSALATPRSGPGDLLSSRLA